MSESRLSEVLRERVADLTTTDLAGPAWAAGRAVRRRRQGYAAGALAVVTVLTVAVIPRFGSGTSAPAGARGEGETYAGSSVVRGPTPAQEAELPPLRPALAPVLDVDTAESTTEPALASVAVALIDRGVLQRVRLGSPGAWHDVDVSRLAPVAGEYGAPQPPVVDAMLSPDGAWVLFPQDGSLELYEVETRRWTSVPTAQGATWAAHWSGYRTIEMPGTSRATVDGRPGPQTTRADVVVGVEVPGTEGSEGPILVGPDLSSPDGAVAYGPAVADVEISGGDLSAQSLGGATRPTRTEPSEPSELAATEKVLVSRSGAAPRQWLSLTATPDAVRPQSCCPVVGWYDADTVAYLSRGETPRLIGWRVGTAEFGLLSEIEGLERWSDYRVGFAFARLSRG